MKRTSLSSSAPVRSGHVLKHAAAALTIIISCTVTVSCIYDTPRGDEFYRTLWKSDEVPLGPFDVSTLALEFLCNDGISVKTAGTAPDSGESDVSRTIYGTYACDGLTATFRDLTLYLPMSAGDGTISGGTAEVGTINDGTVSDGTTDEGLIDGEGTTDEGQTTGDYTVTFIEAHRSGDTLFLLWRVDGMLYPFTTAMHRLSDYE